MKKLILLIPVFLLSGCALLKVFDNPVPVKPKFPELPEKLMVACPELQQVEPTEKLSDVLKVVTKNYSQYHECRILVDEWLYWYREQKKIYEK